MKDILCLLLAKGLNRGFPRKHFARLRDPEWGTRRVIDFSVRHMRQIPAAGHVAVCTESEEIYRACRETLPEIRWFREPEDVADNAVPIYTPIRLAAEWYHREHHPIDAVLVVYGATPLVPEGVFQECIEMLERTGCDTVYTAQPLIAPPWKALRIDEAGRARSYLTGDCAPFRPDGWKARQSQPNVYNSTCACRLFRMQDLLDGTTGRDPRAVVHGREGYCEIEDRVDLAIAQALLLDRQPDRPPALAPPDEMM